MAEPVDLDVYLDAVVAAVGAVAGVSTCLSDGLVVETDASPMVLVDPTAFEPLDDLGAVGWHVDVQLELVVLYPRTTATARRAALALAKTVAEACRFATWGLPVGPAVVRSCYRDDSEPFGKGWECVRVELGQAVLWRVELETPDPTPTTVWLGRSPDIGLEHVDDYRRVVPEDSP